MKVSFVYEGKAILTNHQLPCNSNDTAEGYKEQTQPEEISMLKVKSLACTATVKSLGQEWLIIPYRFPLYYCQSWLQRFHRNCGQKGLEDHSVEPPGTPVA